LKKNRSPVLNGFTLMEVLVALAILSIALVAIVTANAALENTVMTTEQKISASLFAHNIMAHIQAFGIDKYDQAGDDSIFAHNDDFEYDVQVDATDIVNLRRVKVIIKNNGMPIYQEEGFF